MESNLKYLVLSLNVFARCLETGLESNFVLDSIFFFTHSCFRAISLSLPSSHSHSESQSLTHSVNRLPTFTHTHFCSFISLSHSSLSISLFLLSLPYLILHFLFSSLPALSLFPPVLSSSFPLCMCVSLCRPFVAVRHLFFLTTLVATNPPHSSLHSPTPLYSQPDC